jgi:hypothetical protein
MLQSSNIWQEIKIAFTTTLRAAQTREIFAAILLRIFRLPVSSLRTYRLKYTKLPFYILFCMAVKLGLL